MTDMRLKLIASSMAAMMAIGHFSAKTPMIERRSQYPGLEQWVDSVFAQLSEREKVAQLMMPVLAPADTANLEGNLRILVGDEHIGGLLVSKGTAAQYAATVNRAQALSKVPLMISVDGEWGVSMRVTDALLFPRNLIVGAVADDHLAYQYGREIARQCRLLGINVDFAPVLDVNTNPLNPVIGDRSLGESARNVYRKGLTIAKGIEDGGVLSVAKHFPGHGSTSEDSHKTLPVVDKSLRDLQMVDLLPFRKYIDSGLGGVLTAHLFVPSLDSSSTPCSLSRKVVTDFLKGKMKFRGLVFTDALGMKGAQSERSASVMALMAGNDVLLSPKNVPAEIDSVLNAVANGEILQADVDVRCRKILQYKYMLHCHEFEPIDTVGIAGRLNSASSSDLLHKISDASMTCFRNNASILPLNEDGGVSVVKVAGCERFVECCLSHDGVKAYDFVYENSNVIILPVTGNDAYQCKLLQNALRTGRKVVAVFFINPYKAADMAESLNKENLAAIMAYDRNAVAQESAAKAVFGEIAVDGKLPVSIVGVAKSGYGIKLKSKK